MRRPRPRLERSAAARRRPEGRSCPGGEPVRQRPGVLGGGRLRAQPVACDAPPGPGLEPPGQPGHGPSWRRPGRDGAAQWRHQRRVAGLDQAASRLVGLPQPGPARQGPAQPGRIRPRRAGGRRRPVDGAGVLPRRQRADVAAHLPVVRPVAPSGTAAARPGKERALRCGRNGHWPVRGLLEGGTWAAMGSVRIWPQLAGAAVPRRSSPLSHPGLSRRAGLPGSQRTGGPGPVLYTCRSDLRTPVNEVIHA